MIHIESARFIKGIKGSDPILHDGIPQIAFVGRSNAGKSSVINALLGRNTLARTSVRPGKTMEINFYLVNERFYFVDIPGYGYARAGLAGRIKLKKFIEWYLASGEARPVCVVLITDIKAGLLESDAEIIALLRAEGYPYIIVANKADTLNQKETAHQIAEIKRTNDEMEIILHSARTKRGTDALLARILEGDRRSTAR